MQSIQLCLYINVYLYKCIFICRRDILPCKREIDKGRGLDMRAGSAIQGHEKFDAEKKKNDVRLFIFFVDALIISTPSP